MRIKIATIGSDGHHADARASFTNLAEVDAVGRHQLEDDPAEADAILFVDLQQHPRDPLLKQLRRHPLARMYPRKTFVYDERDFPVFTLPGVYVGAPTNWARRFPVHGGPYPSLLNPVPSATQEPDLLFSFRGALSHPVRERLLGVSHPRAVMEESASVFVGHGEYAADGAAFERYAQLVQRSKFVLCPRGHGPSSFRLYEALGAHRVPVVISDEWLPPPRVDWGRCVIRVPEADVDEIAEHLEAAEPNWQQVVVDGDAARAEFSRSHLWNHYGDSLTMLSSARRLPIHHALGLPRRLRVRARMMRDRASQARS